MTQVFKGDIIDLVEKSNLISDRLYKFKITFPNFNYKIRLNLNKEDPYLRIDTKS